MLSDAFEAFAQIFSQPLRKVMWKSLFLALALCLDHLAASIMPLGPAWLTWLLSIAVALGYWPAWFSLRRRHNINCAPHNLNHR
jgi:hypothetical protein